MPRPLGGGGGSIGVPVSGHIDDRIRKVFGNHNRPVRPGGGFGGGLSVGAFPHLGRW